MHIIVQYVNEIGKLHKNKFDFRNHTAVKIGEGGMPTEGGDLNRTPGLLYSPGTHRSWSQESARHINNALVKNVDCSEIAGSAQDIVCSTGAYSKGCALRVGQSV